MKVEKTKLNGVLLIKPLVFEDHRGVYVETYNKANYKTAGITCDFVQDDYSRSHKNVLRGLHGDSETWKLVSCPYGMIYLVVVDCRQEKSTFGKWRGFVLSGKNGQQVLVPPGFGNGHLVLSDEAVFHYKQSAYYNPDTQFSYRYDDPAFGITWPLPVEPILSKRDGEAAWISR